MIKELMRPESLETSRNMRTDRESGAIQLGAASGWDWAIRKLDEIEHVVVERGSLLPSGEFFEVLITGHDFFIRILGDLWVIDHFNAFSDDVDGRVAPTSIFT